jgi:hypothetical protein
MYRLKKILVFLRNAYSLDLRALSLMRIVLGLVIIADLAIRIQDLGAHYTDDGIWPRRLVETFGWRSGYWTLHTLSGTFTFQLVVFILHILAACLLTVGYKTRAITIVVWLLTISLHNRNLYILQSGDDLLRLTLFWAIFLPWGAHYSIDAFGQRHITTPRFVVRFGYLLLVASVYFFSVCLKTGPEWRGEGTAAYYALSLEQLRLPYTGDFIYRFPSLLKMITWMVLGAEILIPFLILFPTRSGHTRTAAFIMICMLHIGIGLTLYVGLFYIISIATAIALLPESAMDSLECRIKLLQVRVVRMVPPRKWYRYISGAICIFALVMGLIINAGTVRNFSYELRRELWYPVSLLRLDQNWGMFSPDVMKKDGWFVLHGIDSHGVEWDLRHNKNQVDYTKPPHIVSLYPSDRWRKLAENMQNDNFTFLRPLYGEYILRSWNKSHPERRIETLSVYYMEKNNLPNYRTSEIKKVLYCVSNEH